MRTVNTFKIGADPEYIALDKAGQHFNVKAYTNKEKEVGWDHSGDVLEVRPQPSRCTYRLIRRIRKLLLEHEVSKTLIKDGIRFRSGAYLRIPRKVITLGGHVHFDIPFSAHSSYVGDNIDLAYLLPENKNRIKRLNELTKLLEQLDILPQIESQQRHGYCNNNYSGPLSVRCGNKDNHLEYRAMASWLHSPIAALVCLTAAKLAAAHPEVDINENLKKYFEFFKSKDTDAARVYEKIFERKLKLEAQLDVDLQDSWKSIKHLRGVEDEISSAL